MKVPLLAQQALEFIDQLTRAGGTVHFSDLTFEDSSREFFSYIFKKSNMSDEQCNMASISGFSPTRCERLVLMLVHALMCLPNTSAEAKFVQ